MLYLIRKCAPGFDAAPGRTDEEYLHLPAFTLPIPARKELHYAPLTPTPKRKAEQSTMTQMR